MALDKSFHSVGESRTEKSEQYFLENIKNRGNRRKIENFQAQFTRPVLKIKAGFNDYCFESMAFDAGTDSSLQLQLQQLHSDSAFEQH